jgi:hypothetical protein
VHEECLAVEQEGAFTEVSSDLHVHRLAWYG